MGRHPVGFVEEIIEARGYAKAKDVYDDAHAHGRRPPDHPMIQLVQAIEFQLVQEQQVCR